MFDASTLVEKIPDEYKPMVALGIGSLTLVGLALFHGVGLHIISIQQRRKQRQLRVGRPKLAAGAFLFGWSVFLMLALHAVEITMWAFVIVHMGFVKHAYDAIYYCANTYTTLGVGVLTSIKIGGASARLLRFLACSRSPGQQARWST